MCFEIFITESKFSKQINSNKPIENKHIFKYIRFKNTELNFECFGFFANFVLLIGDF